MTILHTNDLHAHDQSFYENGKLVGGFARIAYLIKRIKASTVNVIAVDAGDIFQGTPFYQLYHGQVEVELLNKAGYDLYTIGNHEFDNGPANLATQLSAAHFEILSANLDASTQPQLAHLIKPGVIKNIGDQKVGFVGAITPELMRICLRTEGVHPYGIKLPAAQEPSTPSDAIPVDWYRPVADEVEHLEKSGINKIIVISHCGLELDKEMAKNIPSIDVIVGGHSHTRLYSPVVVTHSNGSSTFIVQTGCYGRALGQLQLHFDSSGNVLPSTTYKLIPITARVPEDQETGSFIAAKSEPIEKMEEIVFGRAQGSFTNDFQHCSGDSALGDLICDAIAESGKNYGVTVSFQNRGGIRSSIPSGPITEREVEEVLPFESTIIYATISGANLLQVMEHAVERKSRGQFLDLHGLKLLYDPSKPPGSRVRSVYVRCTDGTLAKLEPAQQYKIAVNNFTFSGGEGYSFNTANHVVDSKLRTAEVFEKYIREHKVVKSHTDGRITTVASMQSSAPHTDRQVHANH